MLVIRSSYLMRHSNAYHATLQGEIGGESIGNKY